MSLRAKLLLAIAVVNLLILPAALAWLIYAQSRGFAERANASVEASFEAEMPGLLQRFVARSAGTRLTLERVLQPGNFGALCEDVMIVDFRRFSDDERSLQEFNPLGAWSRDPQAFPRTEIRAALDRAMQSRSTQRVAGGLCLPIESGGEVVGAGWFLPHALPEQRLPLASLLLTLGTAVVLLGAFLYFGLDRWVLEPLGRLGATARSFEEGKFEEAPPLEEDAAPELQRVVRAFDRAGRQISRHQEELAQAVDEATERARTRERELVLSQRLAAIGTLAAGISHEINNPLAAMMNAVRRLKRDPREKDEKWLELLDEGLERVGRIVRRTLDFAPRTHTPLPFSLGEAVERARALVAHRLDQQGVDFAVDDRCGESELVLGDSHEMSQVFLNLFLNSLDAMRDKFGRNGGGEGARLRVEIEPVALDGRAFVRARVHDNGPGASEETLARLFDPFYSTKGATAKTDELSSGLGMSISYSIVEQHGGQMRVRSIEGESFTAEIDLPRRGDEAART